MAKSEGKKLYITDLLKDYSSNVIRLYFFTTKYNEDFDFNYDNLKNFNKNITKILLELKNSEKEEITSEDLHEGLEFLYDDFNVLPLLSYISSLSKGTNKDKNIAIKLLEVIGVDFDIVENPKSSLSEYTINKMIEMRDTYRKNKNWEESDKVRQYLLENNIVLKDTKDGTTWSYGESK